MWDQWTESYCEHAVPLINAVHCELAQTGLRCIRLVSGSLAVMMC